MNSYEFDQPLDLRLKALNLSLSTYHQSHHHHPYQNHHHHHHSKNQLSQASAALMSSSIGSSMGGSIASSIGSTCSINTASSYSSTSGILINNNCNLMLQAPVQPFMSHSPQPLGQQHNSQTVPSQNQNQNQNQTQQQQQQPQSNGALGSSNRSQQMGQHARSSLNIHCQPLNHHQPHPLSRLHPAPSHLQQQQQQQPAPNLGHVQQAHSPQQTATPQAQLNALSQQHNQQQQQQQQLPPRQQTSPPQHYHYQPMPVKSLSISNHHMISPAMSLSSTPPKQVFLNQHHSQLGSQQQQQLMGASQSPPGQSNKPHAAEVPQQQQQQMVKMGAAAANQASCSPFLQDLSYPSPPNLSTNSQNHHHNNNGSLANGSSSGLNPDAHCNAANQQPLAAMPPSNCKDSTITSASASANANTCNGNDSNNSDSSDSNTTPPIIRQHSLVSRYNCKPCGIVFSQPETLRAHQEGYCTKRDRAQTQIRSQSAVSPATSLMQQSTGGK